MLRCLDPNATWTYELPGQDDVAADSRVRLVCRYLPLAQLFEFRDRRAAAIAIHNDREAVNAILAVMRMAVVQTHGVATGGDVAVLCDVLSLAQLIELSHELERAQNLREIDLGKSGSPSRGGRDGSAAAAESTGA